MTGSLSVDDLVLDRADYVAVREQRRAQMIELRRHRRVQLGEHVAVEFENADTLRYQAQEMLFVEGVSDATAAAQEIAVYDRLMPGPSTLAATLMIELRDQSTVRDELHRMTGLQHRVSLEAAGERVTAEDVPPPDEGPGEQTYSVHFLRFSLPEPVRAALAGGEPARLVVDHPAYQAEARLADDVREQLAADLGTHQAGVGRVGLEPTTEGL